MNKETQTTFLKQEEESKYFTPEISDIHVGYEYEHLNSETNKWEKTKIINAKMLSYFMYETNKIISTVTRVPYLTKEQIEAEGWEQRGKGNNGGVTYGYYNKNDSNICTWENSTKIEIQESEGNILFHGECKDINTFRKIIKLLGI